MKDARFASLRSTRAANRLTTLAVLLATAFVPSAASAQTPNKLQSLVNAAAAQFKMAYRHDKLEHRARYEQLSRALAAWKAAPRNEQNDRLLADWLRAAIRRSMPGSREALPPLPEFRVPAAEVTMDRRPADKQTGDPFADDPIDEAE